MKKTIFVLSASLVAMIFPEQNSLISKDDLTPPNVEFTKENDYYCPTNDGYEIYTRITDPSGIDYAKILYEINGGSEQVLLPQNIEGDNYFFKFPVQTSGDFVEFKFDCRDSSASLNQGYTGPFNYIEGTHYRYDSGVASDHISLTTSTSSGDIKSVAVKHNIDKGDLIGVIIRGFYESSGGANSELMLNVWSDDNGLPGARLILPVAVPNPATTEFPDSWTYVDLSSYMELSFMEGNFFIGIECAPEQTGITRTVYTDTVDAGEPDYGRSFRQYYSSEGKSLIWEQSSGRNLHIRCVAHDPVEMSTDYVYPYSFSEELTQESIINRVISVGNIWLDTLFYDAVIEYEGNPGYEWLKLNGGSFISGAVPFLENDYIDVIFDTDFLKDTVYNAVIKFTGNWKAQDVPVMLSVYSGIAEIIPDGTKLYQNYPNPFNPETTIRYSIERDLDIRLSIYNQAGKEVKVLAKGNKNSGVHTVKFNASGLSTGAYYYKLESEDKTVSKKMLMVK